MKNKEDWFKERGYPHLSNKISRKKKHIISNYVSNSKNITKHSFLPLLYKEIKQRRFKKIDSSDNNSRSHKKIDKKGNYISNTKIRKILYATHIDALVYSYYTKKILGPSYEELLKKSPELNKSITAYRRIKNDTKFKHKNNIHFAKEVFDEVKKRGNYLVLAFDIENFFPSLNHKILKEMWAKVIGKKTLPKDHYNIFKSVTNYSYVKLNDLKINNRYFDEKKISQLQKQGFHKYFEHFNEFLESKIRVFKNQFKNDEGKIIGIPQGLPISALLANIYMLNFDNEIVEKLVKKNKVYYRRYSDDIIIICEVEMQNEIIKFVENEIKKIKLKISIDKTEKTLFRINNNSLKSYRLENNIERDNIPLNYLGFEFYGNKTLIKTKNISSFYREMKDAVRTKSKRVDAINSNNLVHKSPIFKRKIYRLYSYKGIKTRMLPTNRKVITGDSLKVIKSKRKYRGNFLKYVIRASDEMESPEIKRQLRNHWKILQKTISKYDFSNKK